MKLMFFIICLAGILPLTLFEKEKIVCPKISGNHFMQSRQQPSQDSSSWIEDFKLFRAAIYQHDIAKVKTYFKFPVLNPNNEIWYLLLSETQLSKGKFTSDKIVPFNEKDLLQHYNKLFPKQFIKSILKIKTDQLFKTGYYETAELEDSTAKYTMYATYDQKLSLLSLNLAYSQAVKIEEDNSYEVQESNVIYYFTVQKNGKVLFKEVRLAG